MERISNFIGLPLLSKELPLIIAFVLFFTALYNNSKFILDKLFPEPFSKLTNKEKSNWQIHFVSFITSIVLVALAIPILIDENFRDNPFDFSSVYSTRAMSFVIGYFLWDIMICIVNESQGFQFIFHGVICFLAYAPTLIPVMHYYGAVFLLYECSTPFLNINWFLGKLGKEGTRIQLINGILLVSLFFIFRVLFGIYFTVFFIVSILTQSHPLNFTLSTFYILLNLSSTGLNLFWFFKIIKTIVNKANKSKSH